MPSLTEIQAVLTDQLGGEFTVREDPISPSVIVVERTTYDRFTGRQLRYRLNMSVSMPLGRYLEANPEQLVERLLHEFRANDPVEQEIERRVAERRGSDLVRFWDDAGRNAIAQRMSSMDGLNSVARGHAPRSDAGSIPAAEPRSVYDHLLAAD